MSYGICVVRQCMHFRKKKSCSEDLIVSFSFHAIFFVSAMTQGIERIPDSLGYLVLNEDGVLSVSFLQYRQIGKYKL